MKGKTAWKFLKKLKLELPYDPAIPLLGISLEDNMIQNDTCTPVFIVALLTIASMWKQPKRPSTEECIKKMWNMYTMEYYSAIKKNEIMPFAATWIDLEIITLSEISQRKTHIIYHFMWIFRKWYKWIYLQNRNRLTDLKNELMVTRWEGWGRG